MEHHLVLLVLLNGPRGATPSHFADSSLGTSKALSRPPTCASCPRRMPRSRPAAAEVKRLREDEAAWRGSASALVRHPSPLRGTPNAAGARTPAGRQTRANARSEGCADDCRDGVAGPVTPTLAG